MISIFYSQCHVSNETCLLELKNAPLFSVEKIVSVCSRHTSLSKVGELISPRASCWLEPLIVLGSQVLVPESSIASSASEDCCDNLYEKPNAPLATLQGHMISRWEPRLKERDHLTDAYIYCTRKDGMPT